MPRSRRSHKQLSDASADELSDSRSKKDGKKPTKTGRFFNRLGDAIRGTKGRQTRYGMVELDSQGLLFAEAGYDDLGVEEDLMAGSDALNEDALPKVRASYPDRNTHTPAISLSCLHLQQQDDLDDDEDQELSLQEPEGTESDEEGLAGLAPLRSGLSHPPAGHNPFETAFFRGLPENSRQIPREHTSSSIGHSDTSASPVSFRGFHTHRGVIQGIIDIESLKKRFQISQLGHHEYEVVDPMPEYIRNESHNPLGVQKSDPITGHVVKAGGRNPLINLRSNSIELPQNDFEKGYEKKYKEFQQQATALLLQQLSIVVNQKDPNIILVAHINKAMVSCDKGNSLRQILTAINNKNPPIRVMLRFPPSVKVDKATQKLLSQHETRLSDFDKSKRIKSLSHQDKLPTQRMRSSRMRKRSSY